MNTCTPKLEQNFEAHDQVLELVRQTAGLLGASPEQADEAARTGIFDLLSRRVAVAVAPDESTLLLTTELRDAWGCEPALRGHALRACPALMFHAGVVFCQSMAGPALICRWPLEGADEDQLSAWIREFARMGDAMDAGADAAPFGTTKGI